MRQRRGALLLLPPLQSVHSMHGSPPRHASVVEGRRGAVRVAVAAMERKRKDLGGKRRKWICPLLQSVRGEVEAVLVLALQRGEQQQQQQLGRHKRPHLPVLVQRRRLRPRGKEAVLALGRVRLLLGRQRRLHRSRRQKAPLPKRGPVLVLGSVLQPLLLFQELCTLVVLA